VLEWAILDGRRAILLKDIRQGKLRRIIKFINETKAKEK